MAETCRATNDAEFPVRAKPGPPSSVKPTPIKRCSSSSEVIEGVWSAHSAAVTAFSRPRAQRAFSCASPVGRCER